MQKEDRIFLKRYSNISDLDTYMAEALPERDRERFFSYRRKWADTMSMKDTLADFPLEVCFNVIDGCNLSCDMCTRSQPGNVGTMKEFDMDLYKTVIDHGSNYGLSCATYGWDGEPTMNRNLPEMIKYAVSKGARFWEAGLKF